MHEYDTYLKLDIELIARVFIIYARLNLKQTQDWLDTRYVDSQFFKIDNASVYHEDFSLTWMNMYT